MTNQIYTKSDFYRLSWQDYGKELEQLRKKIVNFLDENNLKIDAIVPVLRGGATAATYLAYQFRVVKILPVQYKYLRQTDDDVCKMVNLTQLSPQSLKLKENATILIVENNHGSGKTSQKAIDELRKFNPTAKILYAAVHMDYSFQEMQRVDTVFYSKLTNEMRKLSLEEVKSKNLIQKICLFPWESLEEEIAGCNGQKFKYQGV